MLRIITKMKNLHESPNSRQIWVNYDVAQTWNKWKIQTFSNKETHDLFQGRFTTTAHGDIIHSPKTGHTLSMKWWFSMVEMETITNSITSWSASFARSIPRRLTWRWKNNHLKTYLQQWWLSIAMLVYWKVYFYCLGPYFSTFASVVYDRRLIEVYPNIFLHLAVSKVRGGLDTSWYMIWFFANSKCYWKYESVFLGHVGDANRPAISLVKNSFQLLNSWF